MTMHEKTKRLSSSMSPWNLLENQSTMNKRKNQAIIVHVMDFIMTMIGCIVLNIDHRLNYRSFEKIFTPECLETIRIDLENLLRFERKHVDSFLFAWIKIRYTNDLKIYSRVMRNYPLTRYFGKKDIRLEVLRVVNSMIFRRGAGTIFRSNDKNPGRFITDWPCYVEYPRKVRIIAMAEPRRKISNPADYETLGLKDQGGSCGYLEDIDLCEDIWLKKLLDLNRHFPDRKNEAKRLMDQNMTVSEDRTVSGHVCNRVNCPLCYGWLWLPISYCVYTFIRIIIDLMRGFINGIIGYFGESRVGEVEDSEKLDRQRNYEDIDGSTRINKTIRIKLVAEFGDMHCGCHEACATTVGQFYFSMPFETDELIPECTNRLKKHSSLSVDNNDFR